MKFPVFLFLFFAGLLLCGAGQKAWAKNGWPTCPEDGRRVEIYMETSMGNLHYQNGFNPAQLSQIKNKVRRQMGPLWVPNGLTVADENYNLEMQTQIYQLGRDRYCAVIKSAKLFIGYRNINVYVSSKYRQGTCEYESILNHENTHVQIFRDTLYRHANSIESAIRKKAPRIGPVYLRSPDAASKKLRDLLDAQIRPLFKRMSSAISRKNARIDTKANYRREQAMCSNW
ncbi:MAG: hypothetical protein ACNI26_09775 [Terasakiella sp.]|uniref:hypothetical protein n=1 Tax=unclassified Terasakiella TaxID=2614952 RepID=UPI003B005356